MPVLPTGDAWRRLRYVIQRGNLVLRVLIGNGEATLVRCIRLWNVAKMNWRRLWCFRVRTGGRRAHLLLNFLSQPLHALFHIRNIVVILGPVVLRDDASILSWGVQGLLAYNHAPVSLFFLHLSVFCLDSVVLVPRVIHLEPLHMMIKLSCLSLEVSIRF